MKRRELLDVAFESVNGRGLQDVALKLVKGRGIQDADFKLVNGCRLQGAASKPSHAIRFEDFVGSFNAKSALTVGDLCLWGLTEQKIHMSHP